ncbi:flagellar hook assembly protein FlgD [Campylobacterota bacterium DY0563]
MATTSTDGVKTTSATDAYGNTYTTGVSKEGLKSKDFINLMLTELKMQDPTKPVDAASMMDSQLQLSTLEANTSIVNAMENITAGFNQSAMSDASSLIGHLVEAGTKNDSGDPKQYKVYSVEGKDGNVTLTAYEITGYYDEYIIGSTEDKFDSLGSTDENDYFTVYDSKGKEHKLSTKDKTYDEFAEELNAISGVSAAVSKNADDTYSIKMYVENGGSGIASSGIDLKYTQNNVTTYAEEADTLPYSSVSKIY